MQVHAMKVLITVLHIHMYIYHMPCVFTHPCMNLLTYLYCMVSTFLFRGGKLKRVSSHEKLSFLAKRNPPALYLVSSTTLNF